MSLVLLQGSELAGWALGRFSYKGYDMNNNFANLNSVMWDAMELEPDKSKLFNHYIPIPKQYTSKDALVRNLHEEICQSCKAFSNLLILIMPHNPEVISVSLLVNLK